MFDSVSFVTIVDCEDDVNKRRKIMYCLAYRQAKRRVRG